MAGEVVVGVIVLAGVVVLARSLAAIRAGNGHGLKRRRPGDSWASLDRPSPTRLAIVCGAAAVLLVGAAVDAISGLIAGVGLLLLVPYIASYGYFSRE